MSDTLYVKFEQITPVNSTDITLSMVGEAWCENKAVLARCKALRLKKLHTSGNMRQVMSVLEVVQLLQEAEPGLDVVNLGENDFIIDYKVPKKYNMLWQWIKTVFVCLIIFIGSGFAIMAFNNDAGVGDILGNTYRQITGSESNGFTVLEITYSVGLALGILLFYNHISPKKVTQDPTPLEVEMRLYEQNVNTAVLQNMSRKEKIVDRD